MDKNHPTSAESAIQGAPVPWSDSLVLVCRKCSAKLGDEQIAEDLKRELKQRLNAVLGRGKIRVVVSSCLDVCPEGRITLAVAQARVTPVFTTMTIDPKCGVEQIVDEVLKRSPQPRGEGER